jgi:hypothetical protein
MLACAQAVGGGLSTPSSTRSLTTNGPGGARGVSRDCECVLSTFLEHSRPTALRLPIDRSIPAML